MEYRGYRDLIVYKLAYGLATDLFQTTRDFPREERYALTDQIRRSSRSVPANLAECWKRRRYEKMFISKLTECAGEAAETEVWLDFALDAGYLTPERHDYFRRGYDEVNRMLFAMMRQGRKFCHQDS